MKGAIMLSGGGSGKLFAAIGVTYPAGSTLTCTNGTSTLKAKTTTGQWVFAIPKAGTWTVTASDGTNSKSESLSIGNEGQFESVNLSYAFMLFDGGEVADWTARTARPTADIGETLYVYVNADDKTSSLSTVDKVDITGYNTLCFMVDEIVKSGRNFLGLATTISSSNLPMDGLGEVKTTAVAYATTVQVGENRIDISGVASGSYYVCMVQGGTASSPRGMRVSKVWLA